MVAYGYTDSRLQLEKYLQSETIDLSYMEKTKTQ